MKQLLPSGLRIHILGPLLACKSQLENTYMTRTVEDAAILLSVIAGSDTTG